MNAESATPAGETNAVKIRLRSKAQAMDESLALLSQDIASTIDCGEAGDWGLVVAAADHHRALGVLEAYRRENRRWPWRQPIRTSVVFDWGSLAWVGLICVFAALDARGVGLRQAGVMDGTAVAQGQWWRLFTSIFLHADVGHLISNAALGFVLLGLAMGVYGTGNGLLAAYLAGVGGNLAAWLMEPGHRSLGASGMVLGCLGLLAAQFFSPRHELRWGGKSMLAGIGAAVMLFLLLGSSPETDLQAHLGGFACGFLLGIGLHPWRRLSRSGVANLASGILFSALVVITWWLALRHG
jgi:rhomboid protease GluP